MQLIFSISISNLIRYCHLQSQSRSLLIQVNFRACIKAFKFTIFNPPSQYCFVITLVLILFGFLFHKKLYNILLIWFMTVWLGFGRAINKWLNIDIMNVLMTVIFPKGVSDLLLSFCYLFHLLYF